MTSVPVVPGSCSGIAASTQAGFDGVNRDSFFQRVTTAATRFNQPGGVSFCTVRFDHVQNDSE